MSLAVLRGVRRSLALLSENVPPHSDHHGLLLELQREVDGLIHDAKATRDTDLRERLAVHAPPVPDAYQGDLARWPWVHADAVLANRNTATEGDTDGEQD